MSETQTSLMNQQLDALLYQETNLVANLANASALINDTYTDLNWAGFYLYNDTTDELDLGPFQGKVACMHIKPGAGVVGTAFKDQQVHRVANVHEFPGHIACDSASNSEIVVPLTKGDRQIGVLDIDSPSLDRFTAENEQELTEFAKILMQHID
ncbi:GAF domain-containing protein [Lactiplantibacillus mudanjiangensis]|uniref:Histidine kinase [Lactobacillus allii] n=1 Tax=Lactiplantibacillus mudanjiangensis TaxID=1296538 RepID=A0A660E9T8_9LACO|nr:GAF domain-containing protein [Lactiplantibacillus mudanjiangensis]VDG25661.1 histidine kinase [Lactobacillus allii] [Lactiplantibacillus mudanjiangensis]VDG29942.1 histidine kinase [Lactobacillus allii] [Lactiplantibacillus mudanjiangensis]